MYFHLALLLLHSLIISSLCNAMNESDHHLSSDHQLTLIRSFSTEQKILGVGFPTNDTVLTINHYGWSTYCSKTGEQKINSKDKQHITDFDLSKDGKIALADHYNVTVHNIETGDIIYTKTMLYGFKKVTFCANNNTLGVYNYTRDSITIHTIGKDEEKEKEYNTPDMYVKSSLFAGNPTNEEFIIGNKIVKYATGDQNTIVTFKNEANMLSSTYNPDGTVIAIKCKNGYLFHKKNNQDFIINNSKNSGKNNEDTPSFHPNKRFAALLTHDNNIEFWDYTKKTEKPLAIIELPIKDQQIIYVYDDKLMAFAPNGKKLVVIIAGDNTFYTVPTPEAAYYDDATKAQCVAFNWAINNPNLPFIPQDIVTLIMHKLSRIPDFQLPKQITQ
jgi:hypothetical protein